MNYLTIPLSSGHKKKNFCCGKEMLDDYLYYQAGQDMRRKLSACFVYAGDDIIKGYYTLSNNSIPVISIPENLREKFPKAYQTIPVTLLGRLAVSKQFQGQGIGKYLLIDALNRSYEASKTIGSFAVVVDPLDNESENFYQKYGFIKLPGSKKMFIPMKTISALFQ